MANEQIIIEYKAEVEGLRTQLKSVESSLKKVEQTGKESAQTTQKEFQKAGASIKEGAGQILGAIKVAFGTAKVIEFGKESIKAFVEAEENANKLRFAVEKIGGEGSIAFGKLIEQSAKLQNTTIFSDDSIQQAQTQLIQFGLTSDQVEKLIPQIADLASATGTDLASATDKAIQGINGQTRGLKSVGIQFADTGNKTDNLALLTDKLTKFQGASAEALETTAGKAKRLENAFDDIKESIGEYLVNEGSQILDNFEVVFGGKGQEIATRKTIEKTLAVLDDFNKKNLEKIEAGEKTKFDVINENNARIAKLFEARGKQENFQQQRNIDAQIKNAQAFNEDLRRLGEEQRIQDDATLGGAGKAEEAAAKRKEQLQKAAQDLKDFTKKTNDELLESQAQSDLQKLELARDTALAELEIKTEAARAAGVLESEITKANNESIANIIGEFNNKKAELDKKEAEKAKSENDKLFQEAITDAEAQGEKLAQVEKDAQAKRIAEVRKAAEEREQIEQQGIAFIQDSLNKLATINSNISSAKVQEEEEKGQKELADLQRLYDQKLISQEEFEKRKGAIEEDQRKKIAEIKKKEFNNNKNLALIQAAISTSLGVAKALELGYPQNLVAIAFAVATGAAEIATIASQPEPKFAKGVVGLKGKGTRTSDEISARLSVGESVITADATDKYSGLLKAMNKNEAGKFIQDYYIAPALKAQKKKHDQDKEASFADNLMKSLSMSNGFYDGNMLDSLKMSRKNDKEIARWMVKELKKGAHNPRHNF